MDELFEDIVFHLLSPNADGISPIGVAPEKHFNEEARSRAEVIKSLNAAFLMVLCGKANRKSGRALAFLDRMTSVSRFSSPAVFYRSAVDKIHHEIASVRRQFPATAAALKDLHEWLSVPENRNTSEITAEKTWSFFFPEGVGINTARGKRTGDLRKRRLVRVLEPNPCPLTDPGRQVLFTSNVLLTLPSGGDDLESSITSPSLKKALVEASKEPQSYWYDHPIQMGISPEKNEIVYGLRNLSDAVAFERKGGMMSADRITCVLSVSVTHKGLQKIVKQYLEEEISRSLPLKHIDLYAFTESDARRIVHEILIPAAGRYTGSRDTGHLFGMFGVDGEYGRHYSFLKAVAALWHVLIDTQIEATFKIDLDQVFPQQELLAQTGASAFEHFRTPLWGAHGTDSRGRPVELGMIAGALVNEKDMTQGIFTPDVRFPDRPLTPEERIFFSGLPQALSTEAEMMTRYDTEAPDGKRTCIQRVHVTGGTNGILVRHLRKYRPFTPSFIGRAEDQAFILSVLNAPGEQLAYLHKDGLIMRHDKESFAGDAIKAASAGKQVGDYVRILLFSAYARILDPDLSMIKDKVDPFTGCFISRIPVTVALLRFSLNAAASFENGKDDDACELIAMGAPRIQAAMDFTSEEHGRLRQVFEAEQRGWRIYYELLDALENGLKQGDPFAAGLREKANQIVCACRIQPPC